MNWSAIDPSIFGTLFERGLDPAKRSQLGANFTDPVTIMRLVEPVVQRPLMAEWAGHRARIEAALAKSKKHGDKAWREAQAAFVGFLERHRALTDAHGGAFTVAEVGGPTPEAEMHAFTAGSTRLNSAYGFDFLYAPALTPALVAVNLSLQKTMAKLTLT